MTGPTGPQGPVGPTGPVGPDSVWGDESAGTLLIDGSNGQWTAASPPAVAVSGNYQFRDIVVPSNTIMSIPSGMTLRATGTVSLGSGAIIIVGPPPANGLGIASSAPSGHLGGFAMTSPSLASILHLVPGLGGGSGFELAGGCVAWGGGSLAIYAKGGITLGNNALISAQGRPGGNSAGSANNGCGGGGGGVIVLGSQGDVVVASGQIDVRGGPGADGAAGLAHFGGGGGGGGLIHIVSTNAASTSDIPTSSLLVSGGAGGATSGSVSPAIPGYGGGGSAGNGGAGGSVGPASAGTNGLVIRTQVSNVASLLGGR